MKSNSSSEEEDRMGADEMEAVRHAPEDRRMAAWDELRSRVETCNRCGLCGTRTRTVFGQGTTRTPLVFVGEKPKADKDRKGQARRPHAGTREVGERHKAEQELMDKTRDCA